MITRRSSISFVLILTTLCCALLGAQVKPRFEKPILLTSAGQSADVTMASTLFKKATIEVAVKPLAQPSDLAGMRTLVIVAGYSSKGLGAAGISRDDEMARVKALLAQAAKSKVPVLTMHLGGSARRGSQSDDFNRIAAEAAAYLLVVKAGDEDHFFSGIANSKKIPIDLVDKISNCIAPLQAVIP
jgi:hypothetical protein